MDVLPLALAAVPHAGLFGLAGAGPALPIDVLREADVGDARGIFANHVHVRVQDGRVDWLAILGEHCGQAGGQALGTLKPPGCCPHLPWSGGLGVSRAVPVDQVRRGRPK